MTALHVDTTSIFSRNTNRRRTVYDAAFGVMVSHSHGKTGVSEPDASHLASSQLVSSLRKGQVGPPDMA